MITSAARAEAHLRESLSGLAGISRIKGKGCLLGIEFDQPCAPIHAQLLEKKIITGTSSDPRVLRLLPPLSVSVEELDMIIEVLAN